MRRLTLLSETAKRLALRLTADQLIAVALLVSTSSAAAAAEEAGVPIEQVRTWLEDPVFAEALGAERSAVYELVHEDVAATTREAAVYLSEVARDESRPIDERREATRDLADMNLDAWRARRAAISLN